MDLEHLGPSPWSLATVQEGSRRHPLVIRGVQQQVTDGYPWRLLAFGNSSRDRSSHGQRAKFRLLRRLGEQTDSGGCPELAQMLQVRGTTLHKTALTSHSSHKFGRL